MPSPTKATAADADIILKLYELRRDPEMRKARDTMFASFWPESVEDILAVSRAYGTDMNRYLRQVFTYWDMACSLVLCEALNEELFFNCTHEMYPLFAKVHRFAKEFREATGAAEAFLNMEKVIMNTPQSRERLAKVEERLARFKEFATKTQASDGS
jgi:hypothetical protein